MRVRTAIYVADPSDDSDEAVARLVAASKAGDIDPDFLRSGLVKVFADGVMEYPAQTAAMLSPYLDADGKPTKAAGELYFDPRAVRQAGHEARRSGSHGAHPCHWRPRGAGEPRCFCRRPRGEWRQGQPPPDRASAARRSRRLPALQGARRDRRLAARMGQARARDGRPARALSRARALPLSLSGRSLHRQARSSSAAATGTSPPTIRSALFRPPSLAPAGKGRSPSISRSAFRFRPRSTPTRSMPPTR